MSYQLLLQTGMSKSKICITLLKQLEQQLTKIAKDQKTTKSALIESAVDFWLKNKLKADAKKIAKIEFDDLPDEDTWLAIQGEIDKQNY